MKPRRGYSLAVLFLLLAALAVFFALVRSAWVRGEYELGMPSPWFVAASMFAGLAGCVGGGAVAHSHCRKPGVVAMGCLAGLVSGACAGGLLYAGPNAWFYLAGAGLLLIVSLFLRLASRGDSRNE